LIGNLPGFFDFQKRLQSHWNNHPHCKKLFPNSFLACLGEYLQACNEQSEDQEFLSKLNEVKDLKKYPAAAQATAMQIYYLHLLDYNSTRKNFAGNTLIADEVEARIEEYCIVISSDLHSMLGFLMGFSHFALGEFEKSLLWLDKVGQREELVRNELVCAAKIIRLLIYYELEHDELLPYTLRSTYRYLLKLPSPLKTERAIIKFIRGLPSKFDKAALQKRFMGLASEIKEFQNDPYEQSQIENTGILAWLESKIENKPLIEKLKTDRKQASA
jgi:hypothetical protein